MKNLAEAEQAEHRFVVIRAFADEPARLHVVGVRGQVVDCFGTDETRPMPFHLTRSYRFEPELYGELRAAFEADDRDRLAALWASAAPFRP
jgi:hypothetical protein